MTLAECCQWEKEVAIAEEHGPLLVVDDDLGLLR